MSPKIPSVPSHFRISVRVAIAFFLAMAPLLAPSARAAASPAEMVTDWTIPLRGDVPVNVPRERTRPVVLGDIVFIASLAGQAIALHRLDAYRFWTANLPGGVEAAFNQGRSKLIAGTRNGNLLALNTRDGSTAWQTQKLSEWLSQPEIVRGKVIVSSSADEVFALHENTGAVLWQYNGRGDERMTIRGTSSPTVFNNDVFVGFATGKVVSLALEDGAVRWEKTVHSRRMQRRFYDIDMKPYVDEKSVIVGNYDGNTVSLNRDTGDTQWLFPVGSYGGYLVENDRVYFAGTNGSFYSLDRGTGQPVWSIKYEGGIGTAPVRVGEYLVFTVSGDPIYLLDAENGRVVDTYRLGAGSLAGASASGADSFYCLSNYGNLFGFSIRKKHPLRTAMEPVPTLSALNRFGESRSHSVNP
jgi:outer membrane protein assembly factor BamB